MNKSRPFCRVARTQPATESQNTFVESRWKKTAKHGEIDTGRRAQLGWMEVRHAPYLQYDLQPKHSDLDIDSFPVRYVEPRPRLQLKS